MPNREGRSSNPNRKTISPWLIENNPKIETGVVEEKSRKRDKRQRGKERKKKKKHRDEKRSKKGSSDCNRHNAAEII